MIRRNIAKKFEQKYSNWPNEMSQNFTMNIKCIYQDWCLFKIVLVTGHCLFLFFSLHITHFCVSIDTNNK